MIVLKLPQKQQVKKQDYEESCEGEGVGGFNGLAHAKCLVLIMWPAKLPSNVSIFCQLLSRKHPSAAPVSTVLIHTFCLAKFSTRVNSASAAKTQ